jgi:precorrin-4/cobalt-precorrin-4 C11-methyltransferase
MQPDPSPRVWFVGAGPGDPELITVKGRRLLEAAGAILYAGSLVDRTLLRHAPAQCDIRDSKGMTLEEMAAWLIERAARHETVVRLQTGDPGLYGALVEMTRPLAAAGIPWAVVPGVSSAMAAAAAAGETLTLPEVTQTVIFTRVAGRTPMPPGEDLAALAAHRTTLCIFLSITLLHKVQAALRAAGWAGDAPILVVQKASWSGQEKIVRGTLADIKQKCQAEKIGDQALIIASPALGAADWPTLARSKLYDPDFSHRFRRAAP